MWYKHNVEETQLQCGCSYGVAFKLNVVECAGKKSEESAVREFGVAMKVFERYSFAIMVGYHIATHKLFVPFFFYHTAFQLKAHICLEAGLV